ncbi:MAG: polysaccharide ABC transporter ATP-binding protein [Candidatus Paceibacterota bacterium]|jgi:lipopolysaccharide transport system ATP-binding protein
MEPIITAKNLSKSYKIIHEKGSYVTLRDVITESIKHPFKFLKNKAKQATGREIKETFWALKNVNFEIKKGETLGIIGANGSGKSTLLKILSQITPPTEGEVTVRGKMTSLLEVGTGFHPELTGRENIFLNGAILGMSRKEIAKKFDEIVTFAGVEQFLDTPVKYYSSGMYVRLAFAVAAHMEPDILVIDEVLAVGDVEFQKKCFGKIEQVTKEAGRTVLFVSHNMGAIQTLCKKCILLKKGQIEMFGETEEVVNKYLDSNKNLESITTYLVKENLDAQIMKVSILNQNKIPQPQIPLNEKFFIEMDYVVRKPIENALTTIEFLDNSDSLLLFSTEMDKKPSLQNYKVGSYTTTIEIPAYLFNFGQYSCRLNIEHPFIARVDSVKGINFEVSDAEQSRARILFRGKSIGKITTILNYNTKRN